jgi:hypothetical protein
MLRLGGNKMPLGGGRTRCYCQNCGLPCANENFIQGKNGAPPSFFPLWTSGIYTRIVFGIHSEIFSYQYVPLCLEVTYFCNFCEWQGDASLEHYIENIITKIVPDRQKGRADFVPELGCWMTAFRVRNEKDECVFSYQMSLSNLNWILNGLREIKDNPFKIIDDEKQGRPNNDNLKSDFNPVLFQSS